MDSNFANERTAPRGYRDNSSRYPGTAAHAPSRRRRRGEPGVFIAPLGTRRGGPNRISNAGAVSGASALVARVDAFGGRLYGRGAGAHPLPTARALARVPIT